MRIPICVRPSLISLHCHFCQGAPTAWFDLLHHAHARNTGFRSGPSAPFPTCEKGELLEFWIMPQSPKRATNTPRCVILLCGLMWMMIMIPVYPIVFPVFLSNVLPNFTHMYRFNTSTPFLSDGFSPVLPTVRDIPEPRLARWHFRPAEIPPGPVGQKGWLARHHQTSQS